MELDIGGAPSRQRRRMIAAIDYPDFVLAARKHGWSDRRTMAVLLEVLYEEGLVDLVMEATEARLSEREAIHGEA